HVEARLEDASPLVRAMAVWALSRLAGAERFAHMRRRYDGREEDCNVRLEWARTRAPEVAEARTALSRPGFLGPPAGAPARRRRLDGDRNGPHGRTRGRAGGAGFRRHRL